MKTKFKIGDYFYAYDIYYPDKHPTWWANTIGHKMWFTAHYKDKKIKYLVNDIIFHKIIDSFVYEALEQSNEYRRHVIWISDYIDIITTVKLTEKQKLNLIEIKLAGRF